MKNLLVRENNRLNLGKVYFFYLFFALLLQILGIDAKGNLLDTLWKVIVISFTLLYVANYTEGKIERSLILPTLFYIMGQLLAKLFLPNVIANQVSVFSSFANIAVIIAMLYLMFSIPNTYHSFCVKDAVSFYKAFLLLVFYAVLYNLIVNPQAVFGFMNNDTAYSNMISGFFDNKQTFGMFLFMATMCCVALFVLESKTKYLYFALFFFVNLFICLSRTALIACLTFLVMILLSMYKHKRKLFKVVFVFFIAATLFVLVVSPLRSFIYEVIFDTEATMDARKDIWTIAFEQLDGAAFFVGFGEGSVSAVLANEINAQYSHNGIVQVLLTGGILKLVLYIFILVRSIRTYLRIRKYDKSLGNLFLSMFIGFFVYSMGESIVLFDTSMPCVAATILVVALPSCFEKMYKRNGGKGSSCIDE